MALMQARRMKVFLGNQDISDFCHSVTIDAVMDSIIITNLELRCGVSLADGIIRIGGASITGPLVDDSKPPLQIRAITFGRVHEDD